MIPNPYIVHSSHYADGWRVVYRYLIGGKIKFNHVATFPSKENATEYVKWKNEGVKCQMKA